jgi:hypothetical protein
MTSKQMRTTRKKHKTRAQMENVRNARKAIKGGHTLAHGGNPT